MNGNAIELWQKVLDVLTVALSEVTVLQYFGGSVGVSLVDGVLSVELPEGKDGQTLRQQFGYFIDSALAEALGEGVSVVFHTVRPIVEPLPPAGGVGEVVAEELPASRERSTDGLLRNFTFENFVQGPSNQFPVTMAQYVAKRPGDEANRTNPLFMYGPTGVGKTHLLHAIGNLAQELNPRLKVLYTTSEGLMNEYVRSWQHESLKEPFRERFRTPDILLVDDIQYMAGKKGLQDEFFNIFNALKDAGHQIVMTSDRAPSEIPDLVDRLVSRFQSGLCVDVDMPAYETRFNILLMKMRSHTDVTLSRNVLDFIAQRVTSSVRALEGALSCTVNYARMFPDSADKAVTIEVLEQSILKQFLSDEAQVKQLSCTDIQKAVCAHYSVRLEELLGSGRSRDIAIPRQIAIYLCRKLTPASTTDIGRAFSRNHSTVLHSCTVVQDLYKTGDHPTVLALKAIAGTLGRTTSDLS